MTEPVNSANVEPGSSGDTGNGFLVGTEAAQPRQQVDWDGANAPTGSQQPVQLVENQPQGQSFYTEEDIKRVRQEEKTKLYGRVDEMSEELKILRKDREDREAAAKAQADEAATEAKKKEEEAMSAKQLVETVRRETSEQLEQIKQERATDLAVFQKEREFAQLLEYQKAQIDLNSQWIMPELQDFISGSTQDEINASIEFAKGKTAEILGHVQQVTAQTRQDQVGVSPTGSAPVGPMEQQSTIQSLTPQDVASMDMETYKKHRASLLPATGSAYRGIR